MKIVLLTSMLFFGLLTHSQVTNFGNFYLDSSGKMCFIYNFTNQTGATFYNHGELHVRGNFTNNATMFSNSGITYFNSDFLATQLLNGTAEYAVFNQISINNTATSYQGLSVNSGLNLTVNNGVDITQGKLRLMGDAQLIQTHTGISTNTGAGSLLVDQQGAKNAYRYNYFSSPVQYFANGMYRINEVMQDGTISGLFNPPDLGFTTAHNGTDSTSPVQVSTRWAWKFVNGPWNSYNGANWTQLFNMGTTTPSAGSYLMPGQGFTMKGTNATASYSATQGYTFEGKPNNGNYSLNITAQHEYLIGNPYPSALDANDFINDNAGVIDGTLYFWEHWSTNTHNYLEYGGGYAAYNLSGGLMPASLHPNFSAGSDTGSIIAKRYVPIGQGFIVRADTGQGGVIQFKNSQRNFEKEGTNSIFFRTQENVTNNIDPVQSRIRLRYQSSEGYRQLLLAFTDGTASDNFEYGYDGKLIDLKKNDAYFTVFNNNNLTPLVIQGVGVYQPEAEYPISIKSHETSTHKISLFSTENFDTPIYIYDTATQTTHNLTAGEFEVTLPMGTYNNRFKVVFQPANPLNNDELLVNTIQSYYINDQLIIQNPYHLVLKQLEVYNLLGQKVQSNDLLNSYASMMQIPFQLNQAVYIVTISTDKGIKSIKVLKQ